MIDAVLSTMNNLFARLVGIQRKATVCGHWTVKEGFLSKNGDWRRVTLWNGGNEDPRHCFKCLSRMTALCRGCEKPIFPGDSVELRDLPINNEMSSGIVLVDVEHVLQVRCSRRSCSDLTSSVVHGTLYPGDDGRAKVRICRPT